ncbi:hypothetical protein DACRYDRAFT_105613 [Dacryopinax primogenitus]|uniref:SAP domain-containing protein n=1 Tax=Dacryopinax primogenitus (strain DJM 731) TaxID=1858805 RepID=M5FZJ1_DACPD|nr:uncharacterized protein DACRYDRAFT_105613 [Dacryopinax primogenitus]EJU03451.1 hypothetical protein DACRYDRAFT_105613 [Dacryopinax primogenitus]
MDWLDNLKRAEIVRLCKQHGVKVQGKNTDLVAKLRPLVVGPQEMQEVQDQDQEWEVLDGDSPSLPRARTIEVLPTLFTGTQTTTLIPKSSSLGTGILKLAMGIKRGSGRSTHAELADFKPSLPNDSLETLLLPRAPDAQSINTNTNIDGSMMQVDELGPLPAPQFANTDSPAQTIRLVSSQRAQDSPAREDQSHQLLSSMFPVLPETLREEVDDVPRMYPPLDPELPGAFPAHADQHSVFPSPRRLHKPTDPLPSPYKPGQGYTPPPAPAQEASTPFQYIFGSPQRGVSKAEFTKVTRNVLDELNKRVVAAGGKAVPTKSFGGDWESIAAVESAGQEEQSKKTRFEKSHQKGFNLMDSIATHYAARRPESRVGVREEQPQAQKKRKSTHPISAPSRAPTGSTTAGAAKRSEDGEEDEGAQRAKRRKMQEGTSEAPTAVPGGKAEVWVRVRDTPAQRRKLDSALRRRSLTRRPSLPRLPVDLLSTTGGGTGTTAGTGTATTAAPGKPTFLGRTANAFKGVFSTGPVSTVAGTTVKAGMKVMPVPPAPRMLNLLEVPVSATSGSGGSAQGGDKHGHPSKQEKKHEPKNVLPPTALPVPVPNVTKKGYAGLSAAQGRPLAVAGRTPSASRADTRRTASNSSTNSTGATKQRIPSGPVRKVPPTFHDKGDKENMPFFPATQVAKNDAFRAHAAMKEIQMNKGEREPPLTAKKSTLHAPTISSLARMQATLRPEEPFSPFRPPTEAQAFPTPKTGVPRTPLTIRSKRGLPTASVPRPGSLRFSSPLKPFFHHLSPAKPSPSKTGLKRKPRISRAHVISKLNERRNAAAAVGTPSPRKHSLATRTSSRRSLGLKAAAGLARPNMELQRRAKQSEIARRKSIRALNSPVKRQEIGIAL